MSARRSKSKILNVLKCSGVVSVAVCAIFAAVRYSRNGSTAHAETSSDLVEQAMYTREEFFGADAIVPVPTAEARDNLLRLVQASPNDPAIIEKLSEVEEKLGNCDAAEKDIQQLVSIDAKYSSELTAFYERRGRYADEAAELRSRLATAAEDERPAIFEILLNTARRHDLRQYLRPEFYRAVVSQNGDVYPVFEKLIEQLTKDENYSDALKFVRLAETQFPNEKAELLEKEVALLKDLDREKEAGKIYVAAFDPFWTDEQSNRFYEFLNDSDRLREYTSSIKTQFEKDPADFDAAIRLAHYRQHGSQDITPIVIRLENAKTSWTTDELLTVTRFLLAQHELTLGSRFLYTLYNRPEMKTSGEARSRVLYQLFKIFNEAKNQKLPITKGDLDYYRQIATLDTDPGIATGILSLLFSDADPSGKLEAKEQIAAGHFNRAAAYRIFLAYKQDNATSPELAEMYLDIVRLYTGTEQNDVAKQALDEFASRYKQSSDFRMVALKLAEAYSDVKDNDKTREIYAEILASFTDKEIDIVSDSGRTKFDLETKIQNAFDNDFDTVTYGEVLELLINSFAKDKRTTDILAVYSQEIAKHPNTEWLYEARLKWLDQTNLIDDQMAAYRQALDKFQTSSWRDKFARWFLRNDRQADFEQFSTDLVSKLDEGDTQSYLSQFVSSNVAAKDFQRELYLRLYQSALNRFPHNEAFVTGLLNFYAANKREDDWRRLAATYYFAMPSVRTLFISHLAEKGEIRNYLAASKTDATVYKLFKADASRHLSDFENAVANYRELNRLYPHTPDLAETLITLDRSFGQKNVGSLQEASEIAASRAAFDVSSSANLMRSGEIYAEAGNFDRSREQWNKLVAAAKGDKESYLQTATVFWDYFQFRDALRVIETSRKQFDDETLCGFEAGAIQESLHNKPAAIREYMAALASSDRDENDRSVRRLVKLSNVNNLGSQIASAFAAERSRGQNRSVITLGYADYLVQTNKRDEAERLLSTEAAVSNDNTFLEDARSFAEENDLPAIDSASLRRLSTITETPQRRIGYSVELAESLKTAKKRDEAKAVLGDLVETYPTNYGVILKASDLYKRLGSNEDSLAVLRSALRLSKGQYTASIASNISKQLISLDRLDEAEQLLTGLRLKNAANAELFHDLAQIYVRKSRPDLLRSALNETVAALQKSDGDRREVDGQIADLRTEMIDAFTRLKDYHSAVEQHIEIINRQPEDETLVDSAIRYAKRYGGGDQLLAYYQKTATEAFKNYRWNVVLARIYEANGDIENAVRQYRAATVNQPEMTELYLASADLEATRQNYTAAIKNIDKVLELSNDDPIYIRKKIAVLKKAGRYAEAAAEQAKLPSEKVTKRADEDQFSAAERLAASQQKDEARAMYRKAFEALLNDPLHGDMTAADLAAYVQAVREEEPLDKITSRLWVLREKLHVITSEPDSTNAGEAKKRISVLDGALIETVGGILKNNSTDDEIKGIFEDLSRRIDAAPNGSDGIATEDVILNMSRKAGLGMLEEQVLQKRLKDAPTEIRPLALHNLVDFYDSRGAYARSFEVIDRTGSNDNAFVAEHARLAGNTDKELAALRSIYEKPSDKPAVTNDPNVAHYLDLLYASDRDELKAICDGSSTYQLQLINFLLGKGERELAHLAIENSTLPPAWKLSRNAETSLAFREYGDKSECYFCDALQFDTIGNMISQPPDKQRFLVADDWFRLAREYGEWLYYSPQKPNRSSTYLTAMIELRPHSAEAQDQLGTFYLDEKQPAAALEHFRIAYELDPNNATIASDYGAAYYIGGNRQNADEMWQRALDGATPEAMSSFFDSLSHFGLENEARSRLVPKIVDFLKKNDLSENNEPMENVVSSLAASFDDKRAEAAYFAAIIARRPDDTSLSEFLLDGSLIDQRYSDGFYERLISKTDADEDGDYEFKSTVDRAWSYEDAEWIYDQESEYKTAEPDGDHYKWRQKYIEALIDRHEDPKATAQIKTLETELHGQYARPAWLRIAELKLSLRDHKFAIADAERFIGISASSSVKELNPPDIDRYNDVIKMLRTEKAATVEQQLAQAFFSRDLALGQYDKSNFDGFARSLFRAHAQTRGSRILQLMINAANEETRPVALAELHELQDIKARAPDSADINEGSVEYSVIEALDLAARTSTEFGIRDAAISFRRQLLDSQPSNVENRLELAKLLVDSGNQKDALEFLSQLATDGSSTRVDRWQAKWHLYELDPKTDLPDTAFDSLSEFYTGLKTAASAENASEDDFLNSLIDSNDQTNASADKLIEIYAATDRQYAALTLADAFKHDRSDTLNADLSKAAEEIGQFEKAITYEQSRFDGGDRQRIEKLRRLLERSNTRAVDLTVDLRNTNEV